MVEQQQEKLESDNTAELTDKEKEALAELQFELKEGNFENIDKEVLREFINVLENEKRENNLDEEKIRVLKKVQDELKNIVESKDKGDSEINEIPFLKEKEVVVPAELNSYIEKAEIGSMKVGNSEMKDVLKVNLTEEAKKEIAIKQGVFIENMVDEIKKQNDEYNVETLFYIEDITLGDPDSDKRVNLRRDYKRGIGYFGGESEKTIDDALKSALSIIE